MAIDNKPLWLNHNNWLFSDKWVWDLKVLSDRNIHEFENHIPLDIDECIEEHSKKIGWIVSLTWDIDENTTTWDPYHLEWYFLDSWEFDVVEGLLKYRTVLLETLFWYKIEMSVIWESHCLKITDSDNNIVASEIVACLPLKDVDHMYRLEESKNINVKKDWYDHKIIRYNSDKLWDMIKTKNKHWVDRFYAIQQDLIKFWQPQCSYDFPIELEQEFDWTNHKVKSAWITAIKAFSIQDENDKKIVVYSLHWYKKKWGLVYWDAPKDDSIIITRSIFDLNILGKK